jgi:hypothetical protein
MQRDMVELFEDTHPEVNTDPLKVFEEGNSPRLQSIDQKLEKIIKILEEKMDLKKSTDVEDGQINDLHKQRKDASKDRTKELCDVIKKINLPEDQKEYLHYAFFFDYIANEVRKHIVPIEVFCRRVSRFQELTQILSHSENIMTREIDLLKKSTDDFREALSLMDKLAYRRKMDVYNNNLVTHSFFDESSEMFDGMRVATESVNSIITNLQKIIDIATEPGKEQSTSRLKH